MSFDIIMKSIKSFSGAYLSFKHDVIAVQTVVDIYLIFPKEFLEKYHFGNPAPLDRSIPVVSVGFVSRDVSFGLVDTPYN